MLNLHLGAFHCTSHEKSKDQLIKVKGGHHYTHYRENKKVNKFIRLISETLRTAKSTVGYVLKMKRFTHKLSKTKRAGGPQKTTKVDDHEIILLVKKPWMYYCRSLQLRDWFMIANTDSQQHPKTQDQKARLQLIRKQRKKNL